MAQVLRGPVKAGLDDVRAAGGGGCRARSCMRLMAISMTPLLPPPAACPPLQVWQFTLQNVSFKLCPTGTGSLHTAPEVGGVWAGRASAIRPPALLTSVCLRSGGAGLGGAACLPQHSRHGDNPLSGAHGPAIQGAYQWLTRTCPLADHVRQGKGGVRGLQARGRDDREPGRRSARPEVAALQPPRHER